ncbi:MAG TPA: hypothetical protein VEF76_14480 [Patescibacteria group bacterium]|nr:hypothetical protein [Patescibacteria group bacterium]
MKDDLVREIHETLDAYVAKADMCFRHGGTVCNVLLSQDGDTTMRTTYPRPFFNQPPLDFEKKWGVTGIAGHYRLPKGLTAPELQGYGEVLRHGALTGDISAEAMNDKLDQLISALAARNPTLKGINPGDDFLGRYNVVLGVASEFNAKDIQFFIDTYPDIAPRNDSGRYERLWEPLKGIDILWMPAPETLQSIAQQLNRAPVTQNVSKFQR